MDIFSRARRALGDLAQSASTQATVLQLQTRMGELQSEVERQYGEAGRRARELWRARLFADSDFEILMTRITNLQQELEQLRAQVNEAYQAGQEPRPGVCSECGRALEPDDRFCRGCGAEGPGGPGNTPPPGAPPPPPPPG